jgi:hypothetical protein
MSWPSKDADFGIRALGTDSWMQTAQPSAGFVFRSLIAKHYGKVEFVQKIKSDAATDQTELPKEA